MNRSKQSAVSSITDIPYGVLSPDIKHYDSTGDWARLRVQLTADAEAELRTIRFVELLDGAEWIDWGDGTIDVNVPEQIFMNADDAYEAVESGATPYHVYSVDFVQELAQKQQTSIPTVDIIIHGVNYLSYQYYDKTSNNIQLDYGVIKDIASKLVEIELGSKTHFAKANSHLIGAKRTDDGSCALKGVINTPSYKICDESMASLDKFSFSWDAMEFRGGSGCVLTDKVKNLKFSNIKIIGKDAFNTVLGYSCHTIYPINLICSRALEVIEDGAIGGDDSKKFNLLYEGSVFEWNEQVSCNKEQNLGFELYCTAISTPEENGKYWRYINNDIQLINYQGNEYTVNKVCTVFDDNTAGDLYEHEGNQNTLKWDPVAMHYYEDHISSGEQVTGRDIWIYNGKQSSPKDDSHLLDCWTVIESNYLDGTAARNKKVYVEIE